MKNVLTLGMGLLVLVVFSGCAPRFTMPTKTVDATIVPKKSCK